METANRRVRLGTVVSVLALRNRGECAGA